MSGPSPSTIHDDAVISDYEKVRQENIKRNEEFLRSIGIEKKQTAKKESKTQKASFRKKQRKRKRRRSGDDYSSGGDDGSDDEEEEGDGDNKPAAPYPDLQPTRRSRRNAPQTENGEGEEEPFEHLELSADLKAQRPRRATPSISSDVLGLVDGAIEDEEDVGRKRITAASLREYIDVTNESHSEEVSDEQVVHCAHRFSYMSNKALANRLKAITRAAGAKSREKVLVFMYALQASGLEQMAGAAREALEGLGAVID